MKIRPIAARAWECAAALWIDYADRLTAQQAVAVLVAMQRGPDAADPCIVALAAQIIGNRA